MKQLRIVRVFRVLRVFGKVGQLRKLIDAVTRSILPALQALVGSCLPRPPPAWPARICGVPHWGPRGACENESEEVESHRNAHPRRRGRAERRRGCGK